MSAPRFDPTASLKRVRDMLEGGAINADGMSPNFERGYIAALGWTQTRIDAEITAISAIEGPEDGAGEITDEMVDYLEDAVCLEWPLWIKAHDDDGQRKKRLEASRRILEHVLATRAPSESAVVTDEWPEKCTHGIPTNDACPQCRLSDLTIEYRIAKIIAGPGHEPGDGATRKAKTVKKFIENLLFGALTAALTPKDQITREARDE